MFNLCLTVYFSLWDVSRYHYLPPPNKNAKQTIYCFIIVYLNTWNLYTPCWDWLLPILTNGSSFGSRPWCGSVSWSVPSEARHKCPVSAAAGRAQGASLMHQGGLSGRSDASPEVWTEHVVSSERIPPHSDQGLCLYWTVWILTHLVLSKKKSFLNMCILLHINAAILLRKVQPYVISVVSNSFKTSAPQALCSISAKHLRLSDKGGWGGGTGSTHRWQPTKEVVGLRRRTGSSCSLDKIRMLRELSVGVKGLKRSTLLRADCEGKETPTSLSQVTFDCWW